MRRGLVEYLFQYYAYDIGIRRISEDRSLPTKKNPKEYHLLRATQREWYADPFCIEQGEKVFVFFEVMDQTGKGKIGVASYEEGTFGSVVSVLEEPFHLSYPNVFSYDGKYYMIPETCQALQIRLYEATEFPYKWVLKKVLAEDLYVVDTSILGGEDALILYTRENTADGKCRWFSLNCSNWNMQEFEMEGQQDERPGGNAFSIDEEVVRPLQDCSRVYGEKLFLYAAKKELPRLPENLMGEVSVDCVTVRGGKKYERLHTLNRTENYEVIDLEYKKFYPLKVLRKIIEKMSYYGQKD